MSGIAFTFGFIVGLLMIIGWWVQYKENEARSSEHIKACTDPNYFKTRDDLLKENAELKAQLYIEKHKTEYR